MNAPIAPAGSSTASFLRLSSIEINHVTPELIAEHRAKPLGQHSDKLDRLLNYFRREEMPDKYAILRVGPLRSCRYRVMALSGRAGHPPRLVDDKLYDTLDEAYHAVFLLRVNDLLAS